MRTRLSSRILAILLVAVMVIATMPIGAVTAAMEQRAFELQRQSAAARGGMYTAADGVEYAVLYNDYITLYVNTQDGGFAILPATEPFDCAKPLSYASFRIGGQTYRLFSRKNIHRQTQLTI